jgi:hypothetical protein
MESSMSRPPMWTSATINDRRRPYKYGGETLALQFYSFSSPCRNPSSLATLSPHRSRPPRSLPMSSEGAPHRTRSPGAIMRQEELRGGRIRPFPFAVLQGKWRPPRRLRLQSTPATLQEASR